MTQFSVKQLFVAMTLVAISIALYGAATIPNLRVDFQFLPLLLWLACGACWGAAFGIFLGRMAWGVFLGVVTMYLLHGFIQ